MSSLAEHLPPCLQWSSDPDDLARGVRFLPQRLFPQLQRCLESAEPPAPELLWEAWRMRPCALMSLTMMEVSVATMTSWLHAYELAWNQREEDGKKTVTATTTDAENSLQEPYVQACADLLLGETSDVSVPIGAVDGNQHGRVQFLHLDKIDGPAALHPHPQFVWQKFDETFLASLTAAWHLAEGNDTKPCQVFWHITEANGAPAKSTIQTGSSASAAALRAFWHLRRAQYVNGDVFDLILDDDIYVLGSCAANDGHIQDVGDLSAKLAAIQHHHTSFGQAPPATIVIAATAITRTAQNVTAIARASTWAEVEQVGTVEELIAVRSVTVQAAIGYLTCLAQRMDETPWFREGQPVCLSKVEVPAHVLKTQPSARFESDPTSGSGVSLGSDSRPSGDYPDEANFGISSRFGKPHYQARISWLEICAKTSEAVVIVGGAGFGKTSLLKATVRHIAWQSLEGLASRDGFLAFMPWPIYADLENWASCSGPPFETLQKTVLESLPVIESWPSLRLAALQWLMRDRLLRHQENIYFYLDSLDQVYERHTSILRERLQAIDSLHQRKIPSEIYRPDGFLEFPWWSCLYGPRLVISTRESGLSTHPKAMPFPITRLEVAALSADEAKELASKWLGAEQAARLDAHLRATPSLSIVADSPLLLTLACLVQAEPPKRDLPETTAALYQEMMRLLATGAWRSGGARSAALPNTDELLDSLRPVAWQLFSTDAGANRFDRNTMIGAIARATGRSPMEARKLLAQLVELGFLESSGRQNGDEYFHFRHATFREFLAASHLAALINSDGWTVAELEAWQPSHGWAKTKVTHLLDTNAFEPGWEPLFVFIAGLMRQPKPLLEMLADRSTDDIYRYRLGLLCRCYGSLSTDKENELEDLMDRVFPIIERMGRNARRRHPDRWKGWLATVEHLFNLPKSGSRIIRFFTESNDHEDRMMGQHHDLLDILARSAQNTRSRAGMEALLTICEGHVDHRELGDAAEKAVELAERLGFPESIKRLEMAMDAAAGKDYNQIKLARSLLRVRDTRIAKKSFDLLIAIAENKSTEDWCRSMAIEAFAETLDTPLEAQGAAIMVPYLFDPAFRAPHNNYRHNLALEIVRAAARYHSKITFALQCLILRVVPLDSHWYLSLGEDLVRWNDPAARKLGIELFLAQLRRENRGSRDDAAELLIKHGGEAEREEAISTLWNIAKAPIGNGWYRLSAVKALLKVGRPYDDEIKQCLSEFNATENLRPGLIVDAAEIAKEHHDNESLDIFLPQLRLILAGKYNLNPGETGWAETQDVAKLFFGTGEWDFLEKNAFARLRGHTDEDKEDWFSVHVICFGAKSSALIPLTEELLAVAKRDFYPWVPLMRELAQRGWRFQISRRKFVILRRGQEEPRADAEFGY